MKKFKWSVLSLAVILSVCGAFATRPHFDCSNMSQYYLSGGVYLPAGTEGVNASLRRRSLLETPSLSPLPPRNASLRPARFGKD